MSESVPQRIGAHAVVEHISSGELGDVLGCVRRPSGEPTIVKLLHRSPDPVARQRFEREARVCARLATPHTPRFIERGQLGPRLFFATERIPGATLRGLAGARQPVAPHTALRAGAELFAALAYVHGAGVVHRDVKPENIIVAPDGRLFLIDFGIASVAGELDDERGGPQLTTQNAVLGSLAYAAPEQIDDAAASPAGDVYAAGTVMFELLAGRLPFEAPTGAAVLSMKRSREAPLLSSKCAFAVTPQLDDVLAQLLARDPHVRPSSAWQVTQTLDLMTGRTR